VLHGAHTTYFNIALLTNRLVTQPAAMTKAPQRAARRRHLCIVTETYPPEVNGVAMTVARLVDGLRARGHMVSVIRPRQRIADGYGGGIDFRVTLVRGLPLLGHTGVQFGLPAGGMLRRAWTRYRPDAVYVATEGPLGWSAVRAAQRLSIPVLSGFHTNFHSYSQYYGAGWLQPVILRYLRAFHNRTQGTLVPCNDLRLQLQELGIDNVHVLARGVDTQLFHPERRSAAVRSHWGVSDHDVVALYVGRVAPEKNLRLAVAAYRAMKQCNKAVQFVVVGDGPFRATLQKEHPDVRFCGLLTGERLATHYASADVFLFPSETETFGNVTLEAMASGLAVVAYDYAAAKTHITSGKTGIVVPHGDGNGFAAAAARLVREPKLLAAIRRQARTAVATVDWQRVVERFETLLMNAHAQPRTAETSSVTYQRLAT
jgi:glycosyltransferase involved in cell wall biosynthesis